VPATDDAEDTSYFEERGLEGIDGAHDEFLGTSASGSGSPGGSSLASRVRHRERKASVSRRRSMDAHDSPQRPNRARRGSRVHQHDHHRHSLSAFGPNPNPNLASDWDAASLQGSDCGTTTPRVTTPSVTRRGSLDFHPNEHHPHRPELGRRGGGGSEAGGLRTSDYVSNPSEGGSTAGDSGRHLDDPFATEDLALEGSSHEGSSSVADSSSYNSCSTLSEELLEEAEGLAETERLAHADDFMNFSFKNLEQLAHYNLERVDRVDVLTAVEEHHSGTVTPNTPSSHHATPRGERGSPNPLSSSSSHSQLPQQQSQPQPAGVVALPHRSLAEELERGLSPLAAEAAGAAGTTPERVAWPGTPQQQQQQQQQSTGRPQTAAARFSH